MDSASVADWIVAIGTIGAFVIALGLLVVTVVDRQQAQARLVSAWPSRHAERITQGSRFQVRAVRVVSLDRDERPDVLSPAGPISTTSDAWMLYWALANASDEMVSNVECTVISWDTAHTEVVASLLTMPGRHKYEGHMLLRADVWSGDTMHALTMRTRFTDAAGRHWQRTTGEPLRRLRLRHGVAPVHPPAGTPSGRYTQILKPRRRKRR